MRICFVLAPLILAAACGKGGEERSEPATAPAGSAAPAAGGGGDAVAKAQEIFTTRCVPCHGTTGTGDGPASASLDPKPRAFGDPAWQASVTDEHIMKIIRYGGAAVGKSVAMPPNPDLTDQAVIEQLKNVVRSFKK
jgi:mono/diheme cytochrome c family protein